MEKTLVLIKPDAMIKRLAGNIISDLYNLNLKMVGLKDRANHFPAQLSGGERQRVAFARALANDPPLLLADEPTGNLDTETCQKIVNILERIKEDGKTVIATTHDEKLLKLADRTFCLNNGRLTS